MWWLERARPDVLLMQETKLADPDAPADAFRDAGYELAHHGEGRWNGVAIASRCGIGDVVTNFGAPLRAAQTPDVGDDEPLAEARMIAAACGGIRVVSVYAPNGRSVGSPSYQAKLAWFDRLARWLAEAADPAEPLALGGDLNVAPEDIDVWDPQACHGGTHVSPAERDAFGRLCRWGLIDVYRQHHPEPGRYTWWDYRAGNFHRNFGMRIDHLLATRPVAGRTVWAEIDREVVIATERGLDFDALQLRLHPAASRVKKLAAETPASFVAFDLLAGDAGDVRSRPQAERRLLLEKALERASGRVHLTPCTRERSVAEEWFHRFEGAGLDGVI